MNRQLTNASETIKSYGSHAKKIFSRLDEMKASPNLEVLMQIPAANCHKLSGKRTGQWAVNVSVNYRLIFEISNELGVYYMNNKIDHKLVNAICIIEIVDYH